MTYTAGPWEVNHGEKWPFDIKIEPNILDMRRIAYSTKANTLNDCRNAVGFDYKERDEIIDMIETQEANANLIAAAPDLLAALECVASIRSAMIELDEITQEKICAAIAKAKGKVK